MVSTKDSTIPEVVGLVGFGIVCDPNISQGYKFQSVTELQCEALVAVVSQSADTASARSCLPGLRAVAMATLLAAFQACGVQQRRQALGQEVDEHPHRREQAATGGVSSIG